MKQRKEQTREEHYTIGDALVVLFANPLTYLCVITLGFFWLLSRGA